jgi:hypothetical protein
MGKHRKPVEPQPFYAAPPPVLAYPPVPQYIDPVPVVAVHVLGAKNATVAKVTVSKYRYDGQGGREEYKFTAAESSKREQGDVFDAETGELLALARAFQRLSRDLASEANKRVKASTEAQEAARKAAEEKRAKTGTPAGRTKEEWEAMQERRGVVAGRHLITPDFLAELTREQRPGPFVRYDANDIEILSKWVEDTPPAMRDKPRPLDVPALRAARDNLNDLLKNLGDTE